MVVFKEYETTLSPKKCLNNDIMFEINGFKQTGDCLEIVKKTSKSGKEYEQYNLLLAGCDGEFVGDFVIRYLFDRDLKLLFKDYGLDSTKWLGKKVLVSAEKDGDFTRWKLHPVVG